MKWASWKKTQGGSAIGRSTKKPDGNSPECKLTSFKASWFGDQTGAFWSAPVILFYFCYGLFAFFMEG